MCLVEFYDENFAFARKVVICRELGQLASKSGNGMSFIFLRIYNEYGKSMIYISICLNLTDKKKTINNSCHCERFGMIDIRTSTIGVVQAPEKKKNCRGDESPLCATFNVITGAPSHHDHV